MFALLLVSSVTAADLWLARRTGRFAARPHLPTSSHQVVIPSDGPGEPPAAGWCQDVRCIQRDQRCSVVLMSEHEMMVLVAVLEAGCEMRAHYEADKTDGERDRYV